MSDEIDRLSVIASEVVHRTLPSDLSAILAIRQDSPTLSSKPIGDSRSEVWMDLEVEAENFSLILASPEQWSETEEELRDRLGSELSDWIAESRFGWGTQT